MLIKWLNQCLLRLIKVMLIKKHKWNKLGIVHDELLYGNYCYYSMQVVRVPFDVLILNRDVSRTLLKGVLKIRFPDYCLIFSRIPASKQKRRSKKRSLFPAFWLAVENLLRNRLERWAPFLLRFESSNILQRFLRESKTAFRDGFLLNYFSVCLMVTYWDFIKNSNFTNCTR